MSPLSIRVVTGGRAGVENQALGLAEAVARLTPATIDVRRVRWKPVFDGLHSMAKARFMLAGEDPSAAPLPDLWIAAGRASLPLSLWVRGRGPLVVQLQNPRLHPRRFDMVVAPAHDRLAGDNVFEIVGAPNRITPDRLAEAARSFPRLADLPRPHVAVLIGGRSGAFDLTTEHAASLADQIAQAVYASGGALLLSFSRRTPADARDVMRRRLASLPGWIWDGEDDNPLFAFMGSADHLLVTEDSTNMTVEAASTGRPVHILPMVARGGGGKFARLHADLAERGATRPFDGRLSFWTYAPLAETERAAHAVLEALRARG